MPPVFPMATPLLWLVRALALTAVATTGWLTLQKWVNPRLSLAGCGGAEGCATLLESRWSNWFSVPVTLLAATLWTAILLLTLPAAGRWLGRTADQLLTACAILLLAGAIWFGTLMVLVLKSWCPWCVMLHLAAVAAAASILHAAWKAARQGEPGLFAIAGQAGIAGAALLVLGQLFGKAPDTHLITAEAPLSAARVSSTDSPPPPPPLPGTQLPASGPGTVSYLQGTLRFSLHNHPLIGTENAAHVLTGFSDYTCPACRSQHQDLKNLLKTTPPGTFALLILPTPLERVCNPHLPDGAKDHPQSCALASLALALWKAAPEHFEEFHDWLMSGPLPLDPALARSEAARLAPEAVLDESAPWIAERLRENSEAWFHLSSDNSKLPKLLLRDDIVLHGSTSSGLRFREVMENAFPGAGSVPAITPPR